MSISLKNNIIFILLVSVAGLVAYSAAFDAYFWSDDFHTLALARYIDNPLYLFGNHYPFSVLYRPLGLVYWWFCYHLFGLNIYAHHAADFLVYIATVFLIWRIFAAFTGNSLISAILACLVLVHPIAASTAIWSSTRFDMLAVLFMLLAIYNGIRYTETGKYSYLLYIIMAQTLAILSKESGYITPILLTLVVFTFPRNVLSLRAKLVGLLLFIVAALIMLGVRYAVIGGLGGGFTGSFGDLLGVLWRGYLKWLYYLPQYLFYNRGLGILGRAANLAHWTILLLLAVHPVLAVPRGRLSQQRHGILLASVLLLSPGLMIAIVSDTYSFPTPSADYQPEVMMTSRYYYLSLIGLALFISSTAAAWLQKIPPSWGRYGTIAFGGLLFSQIGFFMATSYEISVHWSNLTNGANRRVIEAVSQAVAGLDVKPGCKIYILNTESDLPYLTDYMDVAIKAVAGGDRDLSSCLIQGERAPYYYLASANTAREERLMPLRMILKPTYVGNLAFLCLSLPETPDAVDKVFDDKTAEFLYMKNLMVHRCSREDKTSGLESVVLPRRFSDVCAY